MAVREVRSCDFGLKNGPCGKDAVVVTFGMGSDDYEIDLCDAHRSQLVTAVEPFRSAGRSGPKRAKVNQGKRTKMSSGPSNADVRAWAASQGIEVSERGRIPGKLIDQFLAANA